jgi:hypothetical protein
MNGLFNNNFLIGMLLARDLPRQEQFIAGLVAGQMPTNSPIGPLLLQPLVSRLATEEQGRTSAESNATALQQPLQVELPDTAETARLSVPGVTTASFSRVGGSPGTTVDNTTGVVALPEANAEETISIAVNGTARQITIVRGARASASNGQVASRALTEAELAELGRALITALQGAAASAGGSTAPAAPAERPPASRPPTPSAQTKDRSGQRGSGGYTQHEGAESPSAAT